MTEEPFQYKVDALLGKEETIAVLQALIKTISEMETKHFALEIKVRERK